jgi:hypothetical protein
MQKPPEVPDRKPEKSDDTNLEGGDNDIIARFEISLGQILRVGRTRKRAVREQNDKSTGSAGNWKS